MKLIINKDRSVIPVGTWGTVNENNYEILDFEFPAELEEYNKRIVYYLGNQKVWDAIINNKAIITNAITTKGSVKAYVWLTKTDSQYETDVDFRTQLFEMNFYENENASGIVPTEQQVDGFNTMLTAMNEKIEEINELETTIENAETQRQENEETRQENESTRQDNEQTRQEQEADRERRTDEAIGNIEDKTAEYNANAEAKTTAFNNNATQKTNDFNSNYTQKVNDFNTNATTQKTDFNTNASSKTSAFNSNAETKTNAFNTNATSKTNAFNSNASEKTTTFDNNASTKTSEFNTNAESKTSAFNDNSTQKTTNFNNNASEKTDEFNINAQEKIDEYDEHIVEYQEQIDELQQEVEELSENMPWNTTEQATEISVDDAAKYSRNKLELFGNTEQASYGGKSLIDYSALARYNRDLSGAPSVGSPLRYYNNSKALQFNVPVTALREKKIYISFDFPNTNFRRFALDANNNYIETFANGELIKDSYSYIAVIINSNIDIPISTDIKFMTEQGSTATDYEPYTGGQPSPSPDYPQDIHVVTGNNTVKTGVFNDGEFLLGAYDNLNNKSRARYTNSIIPIGTKITVQVGLDLTKYKWSVYESTSELPVQSQISVGSGWLTNTNSFTYTTGHQYVNLNIAKLDNTSFSDDELLQFSAIFYADYHADYPINLGSIELCKIGDYQDYIYKENGNWYKYGAIEKVVFNGTESWAKSSVTSADRFILSSPRLYPLTFFGLCNYFRYAQASGQKGTFYIDNSVGTQFRGRTIVNFTDYNLTTVSQFKDWLNTHNMNIYYDLQTPDTTQITDETLISQLEAIYNHLALVKGTNHITITPSDLEPYVTLNYMQDLPAKLDNLDSRLSLLE